MRLFSLTSILLFLSIALPAQSGKKMFAGPDNSFQVTIPENWIHKKNRSPLLGPKDLLVLQDPKLSSRSLEISVFEFHEEPPTIEEQADAQKQKMESSHVALNQTFFKEVNNVKWWVVVYNDRKYHYRCYQTIVGNKKYYLYYTSPDPEFSAAEPLAEQVFQSFTFNGNSNTQAAQNNEASNQIIMLDCDAVEDFREGFTIVKKGKDCSVFRYSGETIAPLGKYDFNFGINRSNQIDQPQDACGFYNGVTVVKDPLTSKYGYMDTSGKLIVPCILTHAEHFMEDGYGYGEIYDNDHNKYYQFYFDKSGKRYQAPKGKRGLYFTQVSNDDYKTTSFYRKNGTKAFETKLHFWSESYGEGYYIIYTEQGSKQLFGFMDTTGKVKIPMTFDGSLSPFSNGLSLYKPKDATAYKFSFINKNGQEIIKLVNGNGLEFHYQPDNFKYNVSDCEVLINNKNVKTLLDKQERVMPIEATFKEQNPQYFAELSTAWNSPFSFRYLRRSWAGLYVQCEFEFKPGAKSLQQFTNTKANKPGGVGNTQSSVHTSGIGLINYTGKIIIPPTFDWIGDFDPVSGLAKAKLYKGNKLVEGFINTKGDFVFVMANNIDKF
ncbi:MAG TPA: WG repeat-containing protein [Chitinophagaceae bacterium]|nr:WG repeat-containing protein [Chitinophagaceae bacterium]